MKVTYNIDGALIDVLRVVLKVKAITGMVSEEIIDQDGNRFKYSEKDFHLLEENRINEDPFKKQFFIT